MNRTGKIKNSPWPSGDSMHDGVHLVNHNFFTQPNQSQPGLAGQPLPFDGTRGSICYECLLSGVRGHLVIPFTQTCGPQAKLLILDSLSGRRPLRPLWIDSFADLFPVSRAQSMGSLPRTVSDGPTVRVRALLFCSQRFNVNASGYRNQINDLKSSYQINL